ncbi:MAG: MMPL family transporter [Deltaproteobacteria bacterium]|nr:MMPL family transporter [Deltaproteobacteria bacterium]
MIRDAIARSLERRPIGHLLVAGLVTVALLPGVARLRFEGDLVDLLPRGATASRELGRYARTFGKNDPVTILVTGGDAVSLTELADRMVGTIGRVRGVRSVEVDLGASMPGAGDVFRLLDDDGFERARALLRPAAIDESVRRGRALLLQPGAAQAAKLFRADPLELRRLLVPAYKRLGAGLSVDPGSGYFLSPRGDALVVLARTGVDSFDVSRSRELVRRIRKAAAAARPRGMSVQLTGPHAMAEATERMIRMDLTRSSALSVALVLLVFAVAFGRLGALASVGPPLALGALWTTGLAGYLLGSLNAISVGFAAILVGLGDDLATHLYLAIDARARSGAPPRRAAAEGLGALLGPTLVAATTGSLGFLALVRSDFLAIRDLGILSAAGILLTALAVLLVTPAIAALRRGGPTAPRQTPAIDRGLGTAGRWLGRRSRVVLVVCLASAAMAAVVGPPGFARQVVAVRPRSLEPLAVQRELFARFGGEPGQIVALSRGKNLEEALEQNDAVADALRRLSKRGLVAGWSSLQTLFPSPRTQRRRFLVRDSLELAAAAGVLEARLRAHGFAPEAFEEALNVLRSPASEVVLPDLASRDWVVLVERHLRRVPGGFDVATYVRPTSRTPAERLGRAIERSVPGARVTGYPLFEAEVRTLLPRDLGRVGLLSLTLVAATLLLHFRRLGPALLAVGSVCVGISWLLLACPPLGIEWTAYNLIVVPVLIGIAIDENVFLIHRYLACRSVEETLREGGRAVLTTALTTAAGFATLVACRFDGLRSLGTTAAIGIVACLFSSLVVTPALLPFLSSAGGSATPPRTPPP